MGSRTFEGIRFQVYALEHSPIHVHGFYGSTSVVVLLADPENVSIRPGSILPPNARRSDVKKILDSAVAHYSELVALWEGMHGKAR